MVCVYVIIGSAFSLGEVAPQVAVPGRTLQGLVKQRDAFLLASLLAQQIAQRDNRRGAPAAVRPGVTKVFMPPLTGEEAAALEASAETLRKALKSIR